MTKIIRALLCSRNLPSKVLARSQTPLNLGHFKWKRGLLVSTSRSMTTWNSFIAPSVDWSYSSVLDLERIDNLIYRTGDVKSLWKPPGAKGVFGGQVIGQALLAAYHSIHEGDSSSSKVCQKKSTNNDEFELHSMHCYFLKPGNNNVPILFKIEPLMDGKSYKTVSVNAVQNGVPTLHLHASFHRKEENPLLYKKPMADVKPPDAYKSDYSLIKSYISDVNIPEKMKSFFQTAVDTSFPLDVRRVDDDPKGSLMRAVSGSLKYMHNTQNRATQQMWVKALGDIGDSSHTHRAIAAWASDWSLGITPLKAVGLKIISPQISMVCSIDHNMYFHDDFRADQWMLYDLETNFAGHGRGMTTGRIYDENGNLKISVAQECVLRFKPGVELPTNPPPL